MLVGNGASTLRIMQGAVARLVAVGILVVAIDLISRLTSVTTTAVDLGLVGLAAASVSLFLSFRVSEAYDRWWEARKLWGGLVNASRDFARQVLSLLDGVAGVDEQRALVLRQVAYAHALREHLLPGGKIDADVLRRFLDDDEVARITQYANVPAAILVEQARALRRLFGTDPAAHMLYSRMDETLTEFLTVQGACERIRNTVFPAAVTQLTRASVWLLAVLVPFVVLESGEGHTLLELTILTLIIVFFVWTEQAGAELKIPFAGRPTGTPMRSIVRTIEIDLRQLIADTEIPPPIRAENGVLD